MSMFSRQKDREYFRFKEDEIPKEFTDACNDLKRDNYYWKKHYYKRECIINPKFFLSVLENIEMESRITEQEKKEFLLQLYFGRDEEIIGKCINRAYRDFNRTLH